MITRHRINHTASAFRWEGKVPHELWLWPSVAKNPVFPLTTVLQLRKRGQQDQTSQTTLDIFFPCALAVSNEAPSIVVLRGLRKGDTMMVLMASWALWCNGKPSAITSKRQPGPSRERGPWSRWRTPWRLLLCKPLQRLIQERTLDDPTPQPAPKHGDGHESQVEGHSGSCGRKEARATQQQHLQGRRVDPGPYSLKPLPPPLPFEALPTKPPLHEGSWTLLQTVPYTRDFLSVHTLSTVGSSSPSPLW